MSFDSPMTRYFRKVTYKSNTLQLRNIDYVYLINLDQRPERLQRCLHQCERYQITPHRFSAINGWELSQQAFDEIGVKVLPTTKFDRQVHFGVVDRNAIGQFLSSSNIGKTCVHYTMTGGGLGCYLSHLSILADAYDSGYETIWILEDDFTFSEDPRILSNFIDQLDRLVGPAQWDVLYTDNDKDHFSQSIIKDLMGGNWARPGIPLTPSVLEYRPIGSDFFKIGGRSQTHSMIIRRSGMQKILEFITSEGIFRHYDQELAFIPNIQLFNLAQDVVHGKDRTGSDTCSRLSFYQFPSAD